MAFGIQIEYQVILIALLLLLSAFFAAAEACLLSLSKYKVNYMLEKKKLGAIYVKKLKDNPEKLLSTVLIGNNIVNVAASAIATSISITLFKSNAIGIATGIMSFLILIFGDITPKSLAVRNNESFSLFLSPIIWWISIALYPLVKLIDMFLRAIHKLFGTKKIPIITREEIKSIVKASEEQGGLKDTEKKLVQRIFDFENTTVRDVMTRKKNIFSVSADMKIKDVPLFPSQKMFSRLPVYSKEKDNFVGILYLKDILKYIKDGNTDVEVKQVMRKPFFVFETKKMDTMLRLFQSRRQHMAVVIDDKGRVVGIVTIENILEEMVGEIIDESDRLDPGIVQVTRNEWIAKGSSEISDLNGKTGLSIKESDYVDLDNFIIATLGRAPKIGEDIIFNNFRLLMEDVQGKKVLRARITRL